MGIEIEDKVGCKDMADENFSWLNWSQEAWENWLKERLEERRHVFLSDPDELISGFNREKSHAKDYHGRELLELIQNADDAGIGFPEENKLLIKLTQDALFIANTGIPFSPEGIKSLMVSDNSPKQLLRAKCIGYKGLGFRSVLGWASAIVIISGNLSIGFNEKLAIEWLQNLRNESQKVDHKVKKFEESGILNPIATLSIPYLLSSNNIRERYLKQIYIEAQSIQIEGYDTVICIQFKHPDKTRKQVQNQIHSLSNEILLFLQCLKSIKIESPERNEYWEVERKEKEIVISPQGNKPKRWKLFKREGIIPKEYLKPEQALENIFEIKLAIPTEPVKTDKLFVFFPTEVVFPFPILAHATFELGGNRQHLIKSDVNSFIGQELADLMAKSAEEIKYDNDDPWYALYTISPRGEIDPILNNLEFLGENEGKSFLEILRERIKKYALLPVRNKSFEKPEKAKRIKGNFDDLLDGELFHDLCIFTEDSFLIKQLENLEVDYIDYEKLRERINKICGELTIEQRAEIIYLLVENDLIKGEPPELLIDENREKISTTSPVLLPSEGRTFSLPLWVPQKIINSELTAYLRKKFQVSRIRDLVLKLQSFKVQEYNMVSLISAIVAETNRRVKENPDRELEIRQEMVQAIWNLYSSIDEKVVLPERISVILPTRKGEFKTAKELYFGREYESGRILEYLYINIAPNLFVGTPKQLGFSNKSEDVEKFLSWLGVAQSPRQIMINVKKDGFLEYVLASLKYPAKFEEFLIEDIKKLKSYNKNFKNVQSIDGLEEILKKSDPHAVICWIAVNPDVDSWRLFGDKKAIFEIWPPYKQYGRRLQDQYIPSYPFWLLKTFNWLPTSTGDKQSPNKCCLARGAKDLSPIIGYPAIDIDHPLIKELNLDITAIRNALTKVGVVTDLDDLPWDSFYEILLELPNIDPEGKQAKSLYRTLIGRTDTDPPPSGEKYEKFMAEGKMFGRLNGKGEYYPLKKLYYLDNQTLPEHIASQYPLLELDKRRGALKVKKLFGIEQLTRDKINIKVSEVEEHPRSQDFQSEIERIKPYIYSLRVEEDTDRRELRILKRVMITLCKRVKGTILVDNSEKEFELKEGESITLDSEAYLVAEPHYDFPFLLQDELIADAVGEIFANYLRVDISSDIARIASCSNEVRNKLLDRITGGSGEERVNKTKEIYEVQEKTEMEFPKPPHWEPPKQDSERTPQKGVDETADLEVDAVTETVGTVSVSAKEVPYTPKREISKRLKLNPKPRCSLSPKRRVDPDRAENLAVQFEKAQNRLPKKISYFQGVESYGCDIISFKNESQMKFFIETGNPRFVERFIEVKGRSSDKGSVSLKGNELTSAQKYREKYYIYRIYEDMDNGVFELIELGDPLGSEKDAIDLQYEINPFRSQKSIGWEVVEVHEDFETNDENLNSKGRQFDG